MKKVKYYYVAFCDVVDVWILLAFSFNPFTVNDNVFHNGPEFFNCIYVRQWSGEPGFSPRSIHTKDFKIVLDASLLNTQHYKLRIKGKWSNPGESVAPFPTPKCSSNLKKSLWVALDFDRLTFFLITKYIYIHAYVSVFMCVYLPNTSAFVGMTQGQFLSGIKQVWIQSSLFS